MRRPTVGACFTSVLRSKPVKAVNILFEPAHGTDIQLQQGDASRIKAQVVPDNATYQALEWHSSDESVVAVDPDGTLHGLQVGEAIVTVRLVKGDVPRRLCFGYMWIPSLWP